MCGCLSKRHFLISASAMQILFCRVCYMLKWTTRSVYLLHLRLLLTKSHNIANIWRNILRNHSKHLPKYMSFGHLLGHPNEFMLSLLSRLRGLHGARRLWLHSMLIAKHFPRNNRVRQLNINRQMRAQHSLRDFYRAWI